MLTSQVVEAIAKETGLSENDVQRVVEAFAGVLRDALTHRGEPVTIRHLGTFRMKPSKEGGDFKELSLTLIPQ